MIYFKIKLDYYLFILYTTLKKDFLMAKRTLPKPTKRKPKIYTDKEPDPNNFEQINEGKKKDEQIEKPWLHPDNPAIWSD